MKKQNLSSEVQGILDDTYDVLYSYSHARFYQFISVPEIKSVIRRTITDMGIDEFISHHPILMKNKAKYSYAIEQMLKS